LQLTQYLGFAQYRAELRAVVQQGFERFGHNFIVAVWLRSRDEYYSSF
jgi:protein involved in ribonucleotide reduction